MMVWCMEEIPKMARRGTGERRGGITDAGCCTALTFDYLYQDFFCKTAGIDARAQTFLPFVSGASVG